MTPHRSVTPDRSTSSPLPGPGVLTIAGSDPSGGAGVQADIVTFHTCGLRGVSAITALTAQDGTRVTEVHPVEPAVLEAQLASVAGEGVLAAKTGMLATGDLAVVAARWLRTAALSAIVVDPVLWASDGTALFEGGPSVYVDELLPLATIVTPNLAEAAALAGMPEIRDRQGMHEAGRRLLSAGARSVLVTGGHLVQEGDRAETVSDLFVDHQGAVWLDGPRVAGPALHGTGCMLSAAIAARLALGEPLERAVDLGRRFVAAAIGRAAGFPDGAGFPENVRA